MQADSSSRNKNRVLKNVTDIYSNRILSIYFMFIVKNLWLQEKM